MCEKKENLNLTALEEVLWGHIYRETKAEKRDAKKISGKKPSFETTCPRKLGHKVCPRKKPKKKKKKKPEKISLLDRTTLSHRKYIDMLAQPKKFVTKDNSKKEVKRKTQCPINPCPPRIVLMSLPKKRVLWENWKIYQDILSPSTLLRIDEMLHTEQNIEPLQASVYFKKLDRKKRKILLAKKRMKMRRRNKKLMMKKMWLKKEIRETTRCILCYIRDEPLFDLNYKQIVISQVIMDFLNTKGLLKLDRRNARKYYKKTLVEICDKIAVWIDTLIRFVDVQYVDSESDIPRVEAPSIEEFEGEGESETESEISEGEQALIEELGEEGEKQGIIEIMEQFYAELEEAEDLDEDGGKLLYLPMELDQIDLLIKLLSSAPTSFLEGFVNENKIPEVRYYDILEKLKSLKQMLLKQEMQKKPFMEQILLDWAIMVDPRKVDTKMRKQITEVAALLYDLGLTPAGADMGKKDIFEAYYGEEEPSTDFDKVFDEEGGYTDTEIVNEGIIEESEGGEEVADTEGSGILGDEDEEIAAQELGDDVGDTEEEIGGAEEEIAGAEEEIAGAEEEISGAEGFEGAEEGFGVEEESPSAIEEAFGGAEEGFTGADEYTGEAQAGLILEGEEMPLEEFDMAGVKQPGEEAEGEFLPGEEEGEVSILYEKLEGLEGVIKGHKPPKVSEHQPGTICCLSLKIWAVWLLEITHNAHNWTRWMGDVIRKVKDFASIVRGEVVLPNGEKKVLYKYEWREFCKETATAIEQWEAYSAHMRELSQKIVDEFHGKPVICCPKCLQDHLIKDVVNAHDTLAALTEAMNNAVYWHNTLEELIDETSLLAEIEAEVQKEEEAREPSLVDFEEMFECVCKMPMAEDSVYEIEEFDPNAWEAIQQQQQQQQQQVGSRLPPSGNQRGSYGYPAQTPYYPPASCSLPQQQQQQQPRETRAASTSTKKCDTSCKKKSKKK